MKRGVVMEVKRKKAVILTENGRFQTIRFPKEEMPKIGEEVNVSAKGFMLTKDTKRWFPLMAVAVVIFIFTVLLSGFYPLNHRTAAYVSYDVNPSFSVAVNSELRVISVKTWNQDAADLFADWDSYQNMKLKDFTNRVMEAFAQKGYLSEQPNILIATAVVVDDKRKQKKIKTSLQDTMKNFQSSSLQKHDSTVTVKRSDSITRKKANEHGLSLGKYLLYLEAKDSGKDLSIDSVKHLSISDIEQKIKNESALPDNKSHEVRVRAKSDNRNHRSEWGKPHSLKKSAPNLHKKGISQLVDRQKAKPSGSQKYQHNKPKHHEKKPKIKVKKLPSRPSVAKTPRHFGRADHPHPNHHLHYKKIDQHTKTGQPHDNREKHKTYLHPKNHKEKTGKAKWFRGRPKDGSGKAQSSDWAIRPAK